MSLQIVHVRNSHWAALQICGNDVYFYDSAYTSVSTDTFEVIARLVHTQDHSIKIQMMNVAQQTGTADCAWHAMATLTCLALDVDPLTVVLNKEELRPHLIMILETQRVSAFPVVKHCRPANRVTKLEMCLVYCYCRLPDNGEKMVCCDHCEEWYHMNCIDSPVSEDAWFCDNCKL